jgi:hypothetical protein
MFDILNEVVNIFFTLWKWWLIFSFIAAVIVAIVVICFYGVAFIAILQYIGK